MIEEYIRFSDDDDVLGVWYCGTIEHHFWCALVKKGNEATIDFRIETNRTMKGMEESQKIVVAALNNVKIPMSDLGASDIEANRNFHELLFTIAPTFMDQERKNVGGVLLVGPCKGKEAKAKLSNPAEVNWPKLLGIEDKKAC